MKDIISLLIVGGGPAGLAAARAFREADGQGRVAIVSDEGGMPYDRPALSKELLRGEIAEGDVLIEEEHWLHTQQVELIGGRAVTLDPDAHRVELSGGRRLQFGWCLLATGAEPVRPPVPGADHPGVRTLRSLDDLREIKRRLDPGAAVTVIGSGFIGCEIAASLRALGHPVTLISDEAAPNVGRLGERPAAHIRAWLEELGVALSFGTAVRSVQSDAGRLRVLTDDDSAESTLVIMATGVSPRSELAALAGAELSDRAIPTDAGLRTALPGVLAAGDVCAADNVSAGRRLRVEHWGDALGQGAVAGRTAAGGHAAWADVPGFWSTIGDRTLKYAAWGDGFDQVRFQPVDGGGFASWYGREDRLVGVLAHRDDDAYDRGRQLIAAGAPWS